jgi:hypothetical protein
MQLHLFFLMVMLILYEDASYQGMQSNFIYLPTVIDVTTRSS